MRFKKIKAEAFGCLRDWETEELNTGLIVICGDNEAGKTTLFNLMTTVLYGFNPASRDNNPYVPWDRLVPECSAVIEDKDGREIYVYRRLRSRAEGSFSWRDKTEKIGNNALPMVASLPREVFLEVYAVSIDQMRFPDDRAWQKMQERLLGGHHFSFLKPVKDVIKELEEQAGKLWRSDRRGRPAHRLLSENLRSLEKKREETLENEKELYRIEKEMLNVRENINSLIKEKSRLAAFVRRAERLNPVRKKLKKIEKLKAQAKGIENCDWIPPDPEVRIRELEKKISAAEERKNNLLEQKEELKRRIHGFKREDEKILSREEQIAQLNRRYAQIRMDREEIKRTEEEAARCKERLIERSRDILIGGWRDDYVELVKKIDEAVLRERINSFKRCDEIRKRQVARLEAFKVRMQAGKRLRFMPWLAALLVAAGFLGTVFATSLTAALFAALVMLGGAATGIAWFLSVKKSDIAAELEQARISLEEADRNCDRARREVEQALGGLPVAADRLREPDDSLMVDIARIRDMVAELESRFLAKEELVQRIALSEGEARKLVKECGLLERDNVLDNIKFLGERLKEAERRYIEASEAKKKLKEIEEQLRLLDAEVKEFRQEVNGLYNALMQFEGKSLSEKAQDLKRRRSCLELAQEMEKDLVREYPDIEKVVEEIKMYEKKGEGWKFDDEEVASAKVRIEQIEAELNALYGELSALETERQHRLRGLRLDEIEGQRMMLKQKLQQVMVQRDRLMLLRNIILEAYTRFREQNQPDILKKAGKYVEIITGGRYDRLYINEDEKGLLVREKETGRPLEVKSPLSRGTREQIYLALRLAIADHLDPEGETLPIFMDEVFVNWDSTRFENLAALLRDISQHRQIFLFTCHRWLVEKIRRVVNCDVVDM